MKKSVISNLNAYQFELWQKIKNIKHFVSTRIGGVSADAYKSMNLSFSCGDDPEKVKQNRGILAKALGMHTVNFFHCRQVHSDRIILLKSEKDLLSDDIKNADAIVTNLKGICIFVLVADCVPIILYDPEQLVIAVIHAGWQGTCKKISEKTVSIMESEFGSNPDKITAGIGPCIGPDCYEVGDRVIQEAEKQGLTEFLIKDKSAKVFFDLPACNEHQLYKQGLKSQNIEKASICSHCCQEDFYSYRMAVKNNQQTGRFAAGIMLV